MSKQLPERPDLEQLKNQAKDLLAAGALPPEEFRKGWRASEPVLAVLRKHGLIP